jgi:hypothetical protein
MAIVPDKKKAEETKSIFDLLVGAGQSISQGISTIGTVQNQYRYETEMDRLRRQYESIPSPVKFQVARPSVPSGSPAPGVTYGFPTKYLIYGAIGIGALILAVSLLR